MARKPRLEFKGGFYHVITRGNDRQNVFHSDDDHLKFLSLLTKQKERSPFCLYAFCQSVKLKKLRAVIGTAGDAVVKPRRHYFPYLCLCFGDPKYTQGRPQKTTPSDSSPTSLSPVPSPLAKITGQKRER